MNTGYRLPSTVVPRAYDIELEATPRRSPRLEEVKRRLEGLGYIGN